MTIDGACAPRLLPPSGRVVPPGTASAGNGWGYMAGNQLPSINYIVQLMLENRSFDHMLGFLYDGKAMSRRPGQPFEGLTGSESNPDDTGNTVQRSSRSTARRPHPYFMPGADPGEGYHEHQYQLFGSGKPPSPPIRDQHGFRHRLRRRHRLRPSAPDAASRTAPPPRPSWEMFTPAALPVLSGPRHGLRRLRPLVPPCPPRRCPTGPSPAPRPARDTWTTTRKSFTAPSIFGLMSQHNLSWAIYGYDQRAADPEELPRHPERRTTAISGMFADFQAARRGRDAAGLLIPRAELGSRRATASTPTTTSPLGEKLIQDVYNAVRNGPGWNQHAAGHHLRRARRLYDHVPPPSGRRPARTPVRRVRVRLHPLRGASPGGAGLAADPGRHGVPGTRRVGTAGPHLGPENHPDPLGPARADRQGRRRA